MSKLTAIQSNAATGKAKDLLDAVQAKLKITPNTASRVEGRFDIPVPSYGRCRQSSSQYSSTNRRPDRMESD
jgi:hypothetical protein